MDGLRTFKRPKVLEAFGFKLLEEDRHPPAPPSPIGIPAGEGGIFLKYKPQRDCTNRESIRIQIILSSSGENVSIQKSGVIVALLVISCTLSGYLLWTAEPQPVYQLHSPNQLDSLITDTFHEYSLSDSQIRTQTIRIDSSFSRRRYVVEVPPSFSKTTFHYKLHQRVWPYDAKTIGNVTFPDKDLQIHIAYKGTIHRTIFLYSESID